MKKIILFVMFLSLIIPLSTYAESMTYDEAVKAVKQSMQAWYMRGSNRQYNSPKNTYDRLRHPEDSTAQDIGYSVCSGFTNDSWMEAFGFKAVDDGIGGHTPTSSNSYCNEATAYQEKYKCKTSEPTKSHCKGEYLVYYNKKEDNNPYYYNPKEWSSSKIEKAENFVTLLQPGDVLAYNGHVAIIYDFKYDSNGKKVDALILESRTGTYHTKTKIDPVNVNLQRLFYYKAKQTENNGILNLTTDNSYVPQEGTVHWTWFSKYSKFVKNGKLTCGENICAIIRPFYKGSNNEAGFNYDIEWPQQINTSKARIELPGIFIYKVSSKYDNNSVYLSDTITYTIIIQNNSDMVKEKGVNQKKNYSTFHVVETLPPEVDFSASTVSNTPEGTYDTNNRTIKWDISSLKAGETITLKYKVKVKKDTNNIDKFFEANGKVYASNVNNYIPTGTVKLEIIRESQKTDADYLNCYNKRKKEGDTYLGLIQNTYECVHGKDLGFSFKKFALTGDNLLNELIVRPKENPTSNQSGIIRLETSGDRKIYADMVLNSYWGGLVRTNVHDGNITDPYYIFPRWRKGNNGSYIGEYNRAKTIVNSHFKTGDVLIYYEDKANTKTAYRYTKENGLYAYIYIDGAFVGVNHVGTGAERTSFTKEYYANNKLAYKDYLYTGSTAYYDFANLQTLFGKDSYIIFRPEKVITEIKSIKVKTNPNKTTYYQNQTLDISGGVITATNNDGSTEDIQMNSSGVKVTGYNASTIGEQSITITYKGKSTSFKVMVNEVTLSSISVKTNPTKTKYYIGDSLNLTGGIIKATYSDNSTKTYSMKNSKVKVTGFSSTESGTKTLTVTYGGKTTTFQVQVSAIELSTITIQEYPTRLMYFQGNDLDLTGGIILKKYNNKTTQTVSMTDSSVTVSGYNKDQIGTQTLSISTEGKTVSMEVIVNPDRAEGATQTIDSIMVYNNPTKVNYHIGETLDLTGGKIKVKFIRNSTDIVWETIDMTDGNVTSSGFSSTEEGEKTVTISYYEKTTSFTVVVSEEHPEVSKIEIIDLPRKRNYIQYQEELDVTGGEVTVTYDNNSNEVVDLDNAEVTVLDFDNTTLGEQDVYVIYKGLDTTFPVTIYETADEVEDSEGDGVIQSVELIKTPEKVNYIQGVEAFNATGIVIKVEYEDGEIRNIDLEDCPGEYTLSGFDNTKVGEQTVEIDFHGHIVSLKVNIQPKDMEVPIPNTYATKSLIHLVAALLLILTGLGIFLKQANNIRSI